MKERIKPVSINDPKYHAPQVGRGARRPHEDGDLSRVKFYGALVLEFIMFLLFFGKRCASPVVLA